MDAYRKYLFGAATLQELPSDPPRFDINATNVQSGALWRFSKPYMADFRIGMIRNPRTELAVAVAASSAFPPVLSPLKMELNASDYAPPSGQSSEDLHVGDFMTDVVLTDGGVYAARRLRMVARSPSDNFGGSLCAHGTETHPHDGRDVPVNRYFAIVYRAHPFWLPACCHA